MGLVSDIFDEGTLDRLVGDLAIGHVRYSTAGDTVGPNAQPILIDCHRGPIALGHNGNLVNADILRHELEAAGSIFQSTSDTEVILHLYARSHRERLEDAIAASLSKVMGAFSLMFLTRDALVACRDPWGFRPLVIGQARGGHGRRVRDVRPRSHRRRVRARRGARRADRDRPRRHPILPPVPAGARPPVHLRARLLRPSRQRRLRPQRPRIAPEPGPPARPGGPGRRRRRGARPGQRHGRRPRLCPGKRPSLRSGASSATTTSAVRSSSPSSQSARSA